MMRFVWRRIDPTKRMMIGGGRGLSGGVRGGRNSGGGNNSNRSGGKAAHVNK
jgi:hypothetical protein